MGAIKLWTGAKDSTLQESVLKVIDPEFITGKLGDTDVLPDFGNDVVVLAMGVEPVKVLQKHGLIPKNRTITSLRQKPIKVNGAQILISYHPSIIYNDVSKAPEIAWDAALTKRLALTGSMDPETGDYLFVDSFEALEDYLNLQTTPVPLAADLETLGLDPYAEDAWIVSIQFTHAKGEAMVMRFAGKEDPKYPAINIERRDQIDRILNHPMAKVRGANFKFDLLWLWEHWNIECSNFTMDTTLVGSLLNENRSNSLETHAKLFTEMGGYDSYLNSHYDKGRMDLVPDDDFLTYSGGDTDACYQVSNRMVAELASIPKLGKFYLRLLHPAMLAFHGMEKVGICIDTDEMNNLGKELTRHMKEITERARRILPRRLYNKHKDAFVLTRSSITKDYLFSPLGLKLKPEIVTPKSGQPSTANSHLQMFLGHPKAGEWVQLLNDYNSTRKTYGTYVKGFIKHLRTDGRFHPTAMLFKGLYEQGESESGTVTGRTAFRDPAIQTLPKHTKWAKALRKAYIAPPGYKIVSLDYSQGELRIAACLANEDSMISAYKEGIDLHMLTGAALAGWKQEEILKLKASEDESDQDLYEDIRQKGKSANFGLIYGMSGTGYENYAFAVYGVQLVAGEGQIQKDLFFKKYPKLISWHSRYINYAHEHKYVTSPLGRLRRLPMIDSYDSALSSQAERQAINSPVQSTLSDLALLALGEFRKRYGQPIDCQPSMMVHDQLMFYVKEDQLDVWIIRLKEVMEDLSLDQFGWEPQLPFPVDYEIGPNLAEMKKVKS